MCSRTDAHVNGIALRLFALLFGSARTDSSLCHRRRVPALCASHDAARRSQSGRHLYAECALLLLRYPLELTFQVLLPLERLALRSHKLTDEPDSRRPYAELRLPVTTDI